MKTIKSFGLVCAILGLLFGGVSALAADPADAPPAIRCLVVTGGHDFEREPFRGLFQSLEGISFRHVEHPNAHAWFKPDAAEEYDVLVLYDMWQRIGAEAKTDFINLLKQGKGLLVMHHAIANYNDWDEYATVIGAKYYLKPMTVNGVQKEASQWKHDVKFTVQIPDASHPVTRGLKAFEIHDETYNLFDVQPGVKPLLTTDEPTSGKTIAWAKDYEKSRVVYLQLGHDHFAYENPNFRTLVRQAIGWTAPNR